MLTVLVVQLRFSSAIAAARYGFSRLLSASGARLLIGSQLSGNDVITFICKTAAFCPGSGSQIDGFLSHRLLFMQ
jgi:hypothetical protein